MTGKSIAQSCEIEGCLNKRHGARSMCLKHWTRWERHADPFWGNSEIRHAKGHTLEARFWSKVNKNGPTQPHMDTPCWEFDVAPSHLYGQIRFQGKSYLAHKLGYELEYGPMSEGMLACHKCDNTRCVRHDHIFEGTPLQNMQDKNAKGRGNYTGPINQARGERVNTAKLTAEDVQYVRTVYKNAESKYGLLGELANTLGVGRHAIFRAIHGKSWKHID